MEVYLPGRQHVRRYLEFNAHVLVLKLRAGQQAEATTCRSARGCAPKGGQEAARGDGNLLPDIQRRLLTVGRSDRRVLQDVGASIAHERVDDCARKRNAEIRGADVSELVQGQGARGSRSRGPARARRGRTARRRKPDAKLRAGTAAERRGRQAQVPDPLPVGFQDGHLHQHLGLAVIEVVNQFLRRSHPGRRIADDDRIRLGIIHDMRLRPQHRFEHGRDLGAVSLREGVREIDGLQDLLVIVAVVDLIVRNHQNRVRRYGPPKCLRLVGQDVEGIFQFYVGQVQRNRLAASLKILAESHIQSTQLA